MNVNSVAFPMLAAGAPQLAPVEAPAQTPQERVEIGLAALRELENAPETAAAATLGLRAIEAAKGAPVEEQAAAIEAVIAHADAKSVEALAAIGLEISKAITLVGSGGALNAVVASLEDHPDGAAIRLGWSALEHYPTNLMSHTYAARYILEAPTATAGAALATVGGKVYSEFGLRGDTGRSVPAAFKYIDALQGDAEVGTAMWFAKDVWAGLDGFDNLMAYVLDATFAHPTAATGAELAALSLEALEAVPEGCPKPAARLAGSLLHALRRLYDDGESRRRVDEALAKVDVAMATSMAFGGGGPVFEDARVVARETLEALKTTEDSTTRLRRRVEEAGPAGGAISQQDDGVVIGGVRVPRRKAD